MTIFFLQKLLGFYSPRMKANVCMCWHEGTGGHVWGTCCGNRYMCGFTEGEVKAEGCSCSCLEGPSFALNERTEAKSRNRPCATVIWVIQSSMGVSHTLHLAAIWASKDTRVKLPLLFQVLFLGYSWDKHGKYKRKIRHLKWKVYWLKPKVINSGLGLVTNMSASTSLVSTNRN